MKTLLIVNPSASAVSARNRVLVRNALAAAHEVEVAETSRRGHAIRLALGAAATGFELVVAFGGDGTVNEVANGLARGNTAMAVLPGGSTNVFARTLGFTNDPVAASEQLVSALKGGNGTFRRIGLGNVNGRFFCFHVGMGFDAAVVAEVEKRDTFKRWLGHPLFIYAGITTWARHFDRRRVPFFAELLGGNGEVCERVDGFLAIAMNTDPYTFLGSRPLSLVPDAGLDDPLALVSLTSMSLRETLRAVGAAVRGGGRLERLANVEVRRGLQHFRVVGNRPFPWQVDGDHLGDTERLEFHFEPECLTLVTP